MDNETRLAHYRRANGCARLTPKQRKRAARHDLVPVPGEHRRRQRAARKARFIKKLVNLGLYDENYNKAA